jgi:putative heme-binding domain-containing protein
MAQLAAAREPEVAAGLLARWAELGPATRAAAGNLLLEERAHHPLLLTALEQGRVRLGELNLDLERRRLLLFSADQEIRRRAEALFSDAGVVTRSEAIASMRAAITIPGDAVAGRARFVELCSRCHRLGGSGVELGPDLSEIARKSRETLLYDILDPNAAVEPQFLSYNARTRDGRPISGIVREETDERVVVVESGGNTIEIKKNDLVELRTGGLSFMPEGLEEGLTAEEFADLLAFLEQPD